MSLITIDHYTFIEGNCGAGTVSFKSGVKE